MMLIDRNSIIDCNRKVLELFRCKRDQIIGKTLLDFSPSTQSNGVPSIDSGREKMAKTLAGEPQRFEWDHINAEGDGFLAEVSLNYVEIGSEKYVQSIVRDLTIGKKMEADLRQAQKMEAIGTLESGIAHDFNNILSSIYGYTDLAMLEIENPKRVSESLEEISVGARRASELVKQILTFGRKTDQTKRPIRISPVVDEALKLIRSSIPTTIAIKKEIQSDAMVLADPNQIQQIVMNLCTNAYHAMREAGGTLAVTLGNAGEWLSLEVGDTGQGMSQETVEQIFNPYFTTKEIGEGTGLGLAVVHGIVESHGGRILVSSNPGRGATFQVLLPRFQGVAHDQAPRPAVMPISGGNERILFVDDEEKIVAFSEKILRRYGYHVTSFTDGAQALEEFSRRPEDFDLVITDMAMPYMNGAELAGRILAARPQLPVILCSGYSEFVDKEEADAIGIREYVRKPLSLSELVRIVRAALDSSQLRP